MGDDVKCRQMVIFATLGKNAKGQIMQHFIKMTPQGDYILAEHIKGAATFTPPDAQKFIKAANTPYRLQTMAVK